MSGAWGAVNGTHDQIRFYELWNETTPYFPDARGLSAALKNNLDDARAEHLLALRGVELKKIGIESVVAITNAVYRAGDALRMPRPPHPGEVAPLREDSDVILFPCNTVACATCGNLALTVDKGAARKGHRIDLRAFFANGISRPAQEWALLCEKCETLAPERGVSSTRHGYAFIQRKTARKMQTEHPPLTVELQPQSWKVPLWRYPFGGEAVFSSHWIGKVMMKAFERSHTSIEGTSDVSMALACDLGQKHPSHFEAMLGDAFFTLAILRDEERWKFEPGSRITAEELMDVEGLPKLQMRHAEEARARMTKEQIVDHPSRCPYPFCDASMTDDGLAKWGPVTCDNMWRTYKILPGYTPFAGKLPTAARVEHAGKIYHGCLNRPAALSKYCWECLEESGFRKPPEGDVTKGLMIVDASMGKGVWASAEEESPEGDMCVSAAAAESLGDEQITIGAAQAAAASTSTSGRVTRQTTGVRPRLNYRQCLAARKPEPTAPPPKPPKPPKPSQPPKQAQPPKPCTQSQTMGDYMAESYGLSAEDVASVVVNPDAPIPFLGSNVFRVDKIVEEYAGVAEPSFLVKWEGFTEEGNTIEQESDLHPDVVAEWRKLAPEDGHLYPSAHARDVRKGRVKPVAEAAQGAETALTMTKIELQRIKAATSCGTFKAVQEKKRSDAGYKTHMHGVNLMSRRCNQIPYWDWMYQHESSCQKTFSRLLLHAKYGDILKNQIKYWFHDDTCHDKPFMENKRASLPEGSPAQELYSSFLSSYIMLVDEFHFPSHDVTDTYCQECCDPTAYKDDPLLAGSSSAEENNRWAGLQKLIVNTQAIERATLYIHLIIVEHNDRIVLERLRDDFDERRVGEVRAAFGLDPPKGPRRVDRQARIEAAKTLLEMKTEPNRAAWEQYLKIHPEPTKEHVTRGDKLRRMLIKRRRKIEEEREDRERRKTEKEARAKRAASARPPDRPGSHL